MGWEGRSLLYYGGHLIYFVWYLYIGGMLLRLEVVIALWMLCTVCLVNIRSVSLCLVDAQDFPVPVLPVLRNVLRPSQVKHHQTH